MTQTNNEREAFAIADKVIKEAYQDFNNKGNGWWGNERIPNYGILRGAIAKAIREAQSPISQNERHEAVGKYNTKCGEYDGEFSIALSTIADIFNKYGANVELNLYLSPPKKAIPEGWKLVPIEPTPKMVDATWNDDELIKNMSHNRRNKHIYKAMINATQTTSLTSETNTEVGE